MQQLRFTLIRDRTEMLKDALAHDKAAEAELSKLVRASGSTLPSIPGIATRAAAEILLEVGDPRRFTEAGFARSTEPHRSRRAPGKAAAGRGGTGSAAAGTGD